MIAVLCVILQLGWPVILIEEYAFASHCGDFHPESKEGA